MTDDRPVPPTSRGELIRPDGRVERLASGRRDPAEGIYASERPGRTDADAVRTAARSDRRRRRRLVLDPSTGRMVDLEA